MTPFCGDVGDDAAGQDHVGVRSRLEGAQKLLHHGDRSSVVILTQDELFEATGAGTEHLGQPRRLSGKRRDGRLHERPEGSRPEPGADHAAAADQKTRDPDARQAQHFTRSCLKHDVDGRLGDDFGDLRLRRIPAHDPVVLDEGLQVGRGPVPRHAFHLVGAQVEDAPRGVGSR